jgi:hypothetical protein
MRVLHVRHVLLASHPFAETENPHDKTSSKLSALEEHHRVAVPHLPTVENRPDLVRRKVQGKIGGRRSRQKGMLLG